jgi:hypothetical protein
VDAAPGVATGWSDGREVPVQITAVVHEDEPVYGALLEALVPVASVVPLSQMPQAVSA